MKIGTIKKCKVTSPKTISLIFNDNEPGDTLTESLFIQVDKPCEIVAKGYMLNESVNMQITGISSIDVYDKIEQPGIYTVGTGSLRQIDFDVTPNSEGVEVVIKTVM